MSAKVSLIITEYSLRMKKFLFLIAPLLLFLAGCDISQPVVEETCHVVIRGTYQDAILLDQFTVVLVDTVVAKGDSLTVQLSRRAGYSISSVRYIVSKG